jgi:plasmid stabilization system protein ParE
MKAVRLHSRATAEIEAGRDYYNEVREGFGDEFATAVEEAVELIGKQPKAFSPYRKGYRKVVLNRFHYLIFYYEYDNFVWVATVRHASREPDTWMDRTPDNDSP